MTQTLWSENVFIPYQDYVIDITKASADIGHIILVVFSGFGAWGNSLFFICSAWFLLKATTYKKRKWFFMFVEIWTVSIIILMVTYILLDGGISTGIIIKNIFPTLFGNNWYMTCYLLFYPLSPVLNSIIGNMSQKQLLRSALVLATLYIFLDSIYCFFPSDLIRWVSIYFIMAYMQKYRMRFADDIKKNVIFALANAVGLIVLILITEIGGLHISFLSDKMLHWGSNSNPFIIFMSIAMFNIARNIHFKNRLINYISSLSLLIYIIHENLILRTYFRPMMWNYIYTNYGYDHVLGWVFILAVVVSLFGISAAALYAISIQRLAKKVSNAVYDFLRKRYLEIESRLIEKY